MTAVDVDALDAARAAAMAGPWEADGALVLPGYWGDTPPVLARTNDETDAALIVAAVNALPDLLAEVRRGRALREAVDGLAATWERRAKAYGEHDDRDKVTELRQRATALRDVLAATDAS